MLNKQKVVTNKTIQIPKYVTSSTINKSRLNKRDLSGEIETTID